MIPSVQSFRTQMFSYIFYYFSSSSDGYLNTQTDNATLQEMQDFTMRLLVKIA